MMKSRVPWVLIGGLFVVAVFFCSTGVVKAAGKTEIIIGSNPPLTGILSMLGSERKWTYEQAVRDINAKGGIFVKSYNKKLPVRLVFEDAESDPGKASLAVEKLVKIHKADLLLSGESTPLILPSCVAAEKLKTYYHATTCIMEPWEKEHFKWSTNYFFNSHQAAAVPFKVMDSIPTAERPKNLALILEDSADGRAMGPVWKEEGKKASYNFVLEETFPVGTKDFSSTILKMKMKNVDGAIMFAADEAVTIVRQMKENGVGLKYFHVYKGALANAYWDALGKDAQYVLADGWWDEGFPYPMCKELGENYTAHFHKVSKIIGLYYAMAQTLFEAIEKAGTTDSAKVRQAVLATQFKNTTMGNVKYSEEGVAYFPQGAFQWIEGRQTLVYPFDLAGGNKVKVAPAWNQR